MPCRPPRGGGKHVQSNACNFSAHSSNHGKRCTEILHNFKNNINCSSRSDRAGSVCRLGYMLAVASGRKAMCAMFGKTIFPRTWRTDDPGGNGNKTMHSKWGFVIFSIEKKTNNGKINCSEKSNNFFFLLKFPNCCAAASCSKQVMPLWFRGERGAMM